MKAIIWSDLPEDIWHHSIKQYLINYYNKKKKKMKTICKDINCNTPIMHRLSLCGKLHVNEHVWSIETIYFKENKTFLYQIIKKVN